MLIRSLAACVLLSFASCVTAQQAVTDVTFGKTRTQNAGQAVDIYRFQGGAGMRATATLQSAGGAVLAFYTPRGEEMLSRAGSGAMTADVYLPLDGVPAGSSIHRAGSSPA